MTPKAKLFTSQYKQANYLNMRPGQRPGKMESRGRIWRRGKVRGGGALDRRGDVGRRHLENG